MWLAIIVIVVIVLIAFDHIETRNQRRTYPVRVPADSAIISNHPGDGIR